MALGKHLVAELQLEPSVDTLGRWMTHHIAELMTRAEQAEDSERHAAAAQEAAEAILRLWSHRSNYKGINPLAELEPSLRVLRALAEEPPWWGHIPNTKYGEAARSTFVLLRSLTICLSLMESGDVETADQIVSSTEQTRDWQSEEEHEFIQHLRTWVELGRREEETYRALLEREAGTDASLGTKASLVETALRMVDEMEAALPALRDALNAEGDPRGDFGADRRAQ